MNNFLLVFIRFGGFFVFLILESLSLYLVVKYNRSQQEIYFHSANRLVSSWDMFASRFTKYYDIEKQATELAEQNARLMAELEASRINQTLMGGTAYAVLDTSNAPPDTIRNTDAIQRFDYIVARVSSNSIVREDNYLTIDRGGVHGIAPGMGVIASNGIVGVVRDTTHLSALVMSVLHEQANISVSIRRNKFYGSLAWHDMDPRYMYLENIPEHADLLVGDTIQTSGFSNIFPAGLPVGRVENILIAEKSRVRSGKVRLFNDMVRPDYVFVVRSLITEPELKIRQ